METRNIVFAAAFFLNTIRVEHVRTAFSIVLLIARLGGLFAGLINVIGVLMMLVNR